MLRWIYPKREACKRIAHYLRVELGVQGNYWHSSKTALHKITVHGFKEPEIWAISLVDEQVGNRIFMGRERTRQIYVYDEHTRIEDILPVLKSKFYYTGGL